MALRIEYREAPTAEERQAILNVLDAYNDAQGGPDPDRPLVLLLRDAEGTVVGGLWGRTYWRWLFIELLVVPEAARGRGFGTALMHAAEAEAVRRRCIGIWLDTFTFQAPSFYQRLGFAVFGTIPAYPPGHSRHFMLKRLSG